MSLLIHMPLIGDTHNQGTLTASRLPSGYTEVEYLQSDGNQYIDTGYIAGSTTLDIYLKQQTLAVSDTYYIYRSGGSYNGSSNYRTCILYLNSPDVRIGLGTGDYGTSISITNNTVFNSEIHVRNNNCYGIINTKSFNIDFSGSVINGKSYYLFANNETTYAYYKGALKLFNFSYYDNNTLVRNLVPALRNSDSKPGMYDLVTGTFYTNAGSGEFSYGNVVGSESITNNNVSFVDGGKIGKCASFNGSSSSIDMNVNLTKNMTFCCWAYFNSFNCHLLDCRKNNVGYQPMYVTLYGVQVGGSNGYPTINYNFSTQVWYHICVVQGDTKCKLYVNGNFVGEETSDGSNFGETSVRLGTSYTGANYFNGKVNDFRIYDEVLSPQQVKEISRGLVLHYKMCQPERSENLIIGSDKFIYASCSNGISADYADPTKLHITSTSNNGNWVRWEPRDESATNTRMSSVSSGTSITLSYDLFIKSGSGIPSWFINTSYIDMNGNPNLVGKWQRVYNTYSYGGHSSYNYFSPHFGMENLSGEYYIRNPKIEIGSNQNPQWSPAPSDSPNWGNIEYDGSGYGNHGTVSGSIGFSSDSKRYNGSYNFNSSSSIYMQNFNPSFLTNCTVSFWAKTSDTIWLPLTGQDGNYYLMAQYPGSGIYHGSCGSATCYEDGVVVATHKNDNEWHHYCLSGVNFTSWTMIRINSYSSDWNIEGNYSDFRIYATALDATAINELYQLGK